MDDRDDLERRLARRLRPTRVPGADETWHRLAPHLNDGYPPNALMPRRLLPLAALYLATFVLVLVLIVSSRGRPGDSALTPTSPAASPSVALPVVASVRVVGAGIVSVQPAPPFTVWQPAYRMFNTNLTAYAYRASGDSGAALPTTSAVVNARPDGAALDPALAAFAARRSQELLGNDNEAVVVLIYAADSLILGEGRVPPKPGPTRLFTLIQQPADGRALPPGEAAWFSGKPATFIRQDDGVVLSWLAGDTFLTLIANQTAEAAVVFAESLAPTTLVAPGQFVPAPTPTLTIPTPLPATAGTTRTAMPCPNAPASTGRRLICPSDPAALAGTATFTEADVRRQYTPHLGDFGPFIAVTPPQLDGVEFLTAGEVGRRLGRGMNRPDDQLLCVITIAGDFILPPPEPNYPPIAYRAVILILDARTGEWFGTTGTLR